VFERSALAWEPAGRPAAACPFGTLLSPGTVVVEACVTETSGVDTAGDVTVGRVTAVDADLSSEEPQPATTDTSAAPVAIRAETDSRLSILRAFNRASRLAVESWK
jgi:hypothetical protein